jgi:GDPmannose 4,6-dehydratase
MRTAFVSGVTGQDGALLARFLLGNGYKVAGSSREPDDQSRHWRLQSMGILSELTLIPQSREKSSVMDEFEPEEVYNLEGQSSVAASFKSPHETIASNGLSTLDWLESIRKKGSQTRFYQASSSEIFGASDAFSRDETSKFHPRSPYAVSKLFSHFSTVNYREAYGLYACSGILFNHESPYRGEAFVTQKITTHAAKWKQGDHSPLVMGNIHVKRDWGHAEDFVRGMHAMLQQEVASDYVLATGVLHSVKDFIEVAFGLAGAKLDWSGEGLTEKATDRISGKTCVEISAEFFRPADMEQSLGNPIKALNSLGWKPTVPFEKIVEEMVESHLSGTSS